MVGFLHTKASWLFPIKMGVFGDFGHFVNRHYIIEDHIHHKKSLCRPANFHDFAVSYMIFISSYGLTTDFLNLTGFGKAL